MTHAAFRILDFPTGVFSVSIAVLDNTLGIQSMQIFEPEISSILNYVVVVCTRYIPLQMPPHTLISLADAIKVPAEVSFQS